MKFAESISSLWFEKACLNAILSSYIFISLQDWFYYLLVYDPQQKTLLADRGEIGIGDEYQGGTPDKLENREYRMLELVSLKLVLDDTIYLTDSFQF